MTEAKDHRTGSMGGGVATTPPTGVPDQRSGGHPGPAAPFRQGHRHPGPASMVAACPRPTTVQAVPSMLHRAVRVKGTPRRRTFRAVKAAEVATTKAAVRQRPHSRATAATVGQGELERGDLAGVPPRQRSRRGSVAEPAAHQLPPRARLPVQHRGRRVVPDPPALIHQAPHQIDVLADPQVGIEAGSHGHPPSDQSGGGQVADHRVRADLARFGAHVQG